MKIQKQGKMENLDKEKIERIVKTRKQANAYFSKKSKVFRAFCDMEDKTYEEGNLSVKQKRLIAIGIAVAINCESCMEWSIKQAIDNEATTEEIIEAIDVAIEMRGGPATAFARFAMNVIEYYRGAFQIVAKNLYLCNTLIPIKL
jgi:alkylhydroperoxidase/carboxymuconolactone decarboxylase family protein YurZ